MASWRGGQKIQKEGSMCCYKYKIEMQSKEYQHCCTIEECHERNSVFPYLRTNEPCTQPEKGFYHPRKWEELICYFILFRWWYIITEVFEN